MITGEFNHKGELVFEVDLIAADETWILILVKERNPVSDTKRDN
ncbi:hypothetical protein [Planktothricoides raciborskii]|nr:hypothetical protein [Planktothricoides raciborskii]